MTTATATPVRRVKINADDVDVLRRVAKAADTTDGFRASLASVHVVDGLAFASDAYRLAVGEVDCDDVVIPARAVEWLPLDGCTVTTAPLTPASTASRYGPPMSGHQLRVTWQVDGDVVGADGTDWSGGAKAICAVLKTPPADWSAAPEAAPTDSAVTRTDGKPAVVVGPREGPFRVFDLGLLNSVRRMFPTGDDVRIGLTNERLGLLWMWDEEITVVLAPLYAPGGAWTFGGRSW